jgi:cell division protein FtsL
MIRLVNIICAVFIIALTAAVYHVRYSADAEMRALQKVEDSMLAARDERRTLEAEWSSLNDPRRLQELANRYLSLSYLAANQVIDLRPDEIRPISVLLQSGEVSDGPR